MVDKKDFSAVNMQEVVTRHWIKLLTAKREIEAGTTLSDDLVSHIGNAYKRAMELMEAKPRNIYQHGFAHTVLSEATKSACDALQKDLISAKGRQALVADFATYDENKMREILASMKHYTCNVIDNVKAFLSEAAKKENPASGNESVPGAQL